MKATRTRAACAAIALLPAMLAVGTGTAQAETTPTYFTNPNGTLQVIYSGGGMAIYATVIDTANPPGVTEFCHYHAVGVMSTPAFSHDADTMVTGAHPSAPMTIIFQQLGGTYSVNVTCNGTGNSASYSPVVY